MATVPVLARVRVRLAGAARAMAPKLRLAGVICRCDCAPVPVSATVSGRVDAEVVTLAVPVRVPMMVGAKMICAVQLVAGARAPPASGQEPLVAE